MWEHFNNVTCWQIYINDYKMQLFSYAVVRTTPKDTDSLKLLKSMQEGGLWNVSIYPLTTTYSLFFPYF